MDYDSDRKLKEDAPQGNLQGRSILSPGTFDIISPNRIVHLGCNDLLEEGILSP